MERRRLPEKRRNGDTPWLTRQAPERKVIESASAEFEVLIGRNEEAWRGTAPWVSRVWRKVPQGINGVKQIKGMVKPHETAN